jgi:hypothetical protein
MNVHYEIKQIDPRIHCAEVAFSTDVLNDAKMADLGRAPYVVWISLPFPPPVGAELHDYLWDYAPLEYFETLEREALTGANTAIVAPVLAEVGVKHTETDASVRDKKKAVAGKRAAASMKAERESKRFSPLVRRV